MTKTMLAVCVLFAMSAVTASAQDNAAANSATVQQGQPMANSQSPEAAAAKKHGKKTDEKKGQAGQEGQQGSTTDTGAGQQH